jgi:hypothetical protein
MHMGDDHLQLNLMNACLMKRVIVEQLEWAIRCWEWWGCSDGWTEGFEVEGAIVADGGSKIWPIDSDGWEWKERWSGRALCRLQEKI